MKILIKLLCVYALCMSFCISAAYSADKTSKQITLAGAMKVESAEEKAGKIKVVTTGGIFEVSIDSDKITVSQRINKTQEVGIIELKSGSLKELKIDKKASDSFECKIKSEKADIAISSSSGIMINPPEIVIKTISLLGKVSDSAGAGNFWRAGYELLTTKDIYVMSVYPPREFDYKLYYDSKWLWCWDPPTEEYLKMGKKQYDAKYVHIHNPRWKGAWHNKDFASLDADNLKKSIKAAHNLGMKVQIYLNEYPAHNNEKDLNTVLKNLPQLKQYDFDGVYYDGLSYVNYGQTPNRNLEYKLMVETRRILGRNITVHIHTGRDISMPYINAHADWRIGGEAARFESVEEGCAFLKNKIGQFNRSNIIGVYDPESYFGIPMEFLNTMLENYSLPFGGLIGDDGFAPLFNPGYTGIIPAYTTKNINNIFYPMMEVKRWEYLSKAGEVSDFTAKENIQRNKEKMEKYFKENELLLKNSEVPKGIKIKSVKATQHNGALYPRGFFKPQYAYDGSIETGVYMVWENQDIKTVLDFSKSTSFPESSSTDEKSVFLALEFEEESNVSRILYDTHYPNCSETAVWQTGFEISGSKDGKEWVSLFKKANLNKAERFVFTLGKIIKAKYIKIHNITAKRAMAPKNNFVYITEIQSYEK